jgi:hypothetical protein
MYFRVVTPIWLAKQKSAQTRRAYRLDVQHFMRALGITATDALRQVGQRMRCARSITAPFWPWVCKLASGRDRCIECRGSSSEPGL